MENYCKSFDTEQYLRMGGVWTGNEPRVPLVTFTPTNQTPRDCESIDKEDSLVRPVMTRVETRGVSEMPWELVQAHDALTLAPAVVVAGQPTNLNEINRETTQFASYQAFVDPESMPKLSLDLENQLRFSMVQDDRLILHPPAMENKFPRDFVGGGVVPDPIDTHGKPTRFDHVLSFKA